VKLARHERWCSCRHSHGLYLRDGRSAVVTGRYAEVIGLDNNSLVRGVQSLAGASGEFGPALAAWVFPHDYHRITRQDVTPKRKARKVEAVMGECPS